VTLPIRRSPRAIAFIASMSALANVVSLYSIPISILGFQSRIHFQQLPIILGGVVAGGAVGLIIGFFGAFVMAYSAGIPFILGGMAIVGLTSGLFVRKVKPFFAGILAYVTSIPYVAATDYIWGLPLPVIGGILIKLGIEAILCSVLVEAIGHHGAVASFISSMRADNATRAEGLIRMLEGESKGLIILKGDKTIYTSAESGITGLLQAVEGVEAGLLEDSVVVDRVVGKAAAMVITSIRAREVYARIMSRSATAFLKRHSKAFSYLQFVDEIKDRNGLGICKFEEMVAKIDDPEEAVRLLRDASNKDDVRSR